MSEQLFACAGIPALRRALLAAADKHGQRALEFYRAQPVNPDGTGLTEAAKDPYLAARSGLAGYAGWKRAAAALLGVLDDPCVPAEARERGRDLVGQLLDGWAEVLEGANDDLDEPAGA